MSNLFSFPGLGKQSFGLSSLSTFGSFGSGSGQFSAFGGGDLFSSLQQLIMLRMVQSLLSQIGQQSSGQIPSGQQHTDAAQGTGQTPQEPVDAQKPAKPAPIPQVAVDGAMQQVLSTNFAKDAQGLHLADHQVIVEEAPGRANGAVSIGDTVRVISPEGNEVSNYQLQEGDIYDLQFRANQLRNANQVGEGWEFSEKLVEIKDGSLAQPELRFYSNQNGWGIESVVERNEFWEVVERDSIRYLVMRNHDDQGNPVQAADAINHIFENRDDYAFDCASPIPLFNLKSTLDTIGADDFNASAGQVEISGWYDRYDQSRGDGGYISSTRGAEAGEVTVNGVSNVAGELAAFDTAKGDELVAGGIYYFELPGDTTTELQGWNAIYLGTNAEGEHRFWSNSIGEVTAKFEQGNWQPSAELKDYYLSSAVSDANVERLQNWDRDNSVVA